LKLLRAVPFQPKWLTVALPKALCEILELIQAKTPRKGGNMFLDNAEFAYADLTRFGGQRRTTGGKGKRP
jgi:hypothetical protein